MANSFKDVKDNDIVMSRTLLHEAIPLTGAIVSGTYIDNNIKNFSHGMFQTIYDYPYLSSSANHIMDLTCGYSSGSSLSGATNTQNDKKINIYNEMAQILAGFDESSKLRRFDEDGDLTGGTKIEQAIVFNFTRLLMKDEIKKGSFALELGVSASYLDPFSGYRIKLTDYSGSDGFKVNSPAGEYGILYATGSSSEVALQESLLDGNGYMKAGLIYYQAGIAIVTSSILGSALFQDGAQGGNVPMSSSATNTSGGLNSAGDSVEALLTGSAISASCDAIRHRIYNIQFNNTTELNSAIVFCRVNHGDFNYSSNPTYLSASRLVVKNNPDDSPVSYATAVGLYSADSELLAVAKLSEPLKKDPTSEFTLRVRLDY
tara:strand:- start:594 stop:1715 length:1122 start_codon:yes stop_codon:yes gene_type:complete